MRSASTRQLDAVAADDRRLDWVVEIDDSGGTPVDWTGFVARWSITESIEQKVMTASITLHREQGNTSAAPFIGSPEPITVGRSVEIRVALVELGNTPIAGDWEPIFRGEIDRVDWGGSQATVSVECRGPGRQLINEIIEVERTYGNAAGTDPIQTVIQDIMDDELGGSAPTLTTVGSPNFGILEYTQQRESISQAHQALVDLIGWNLRYVWDESSQGWVYTLFEPDRTKSTPDHTFGAGDYEQVESLELNVNEIRNKVEIDYDPDAATIVVSDSSSITEFGEQFMSVSFRNDQQVRTSAQATTLANAILADLSQPRAKQRATCRFFPFVELGDLIRFTANNVHYDTDQDMAVTSYTHEASPQGVVTRLDVRGLPTGGSDRWFFRKRQVEQARQTRERLRPSVSFQLSRDADRVLLSWSGNDISSIGYVTSTSSMPANLSGQTTVDGATGESVEIHTGLGGGGTLFVRAAGYTSVSGSGVKTRDFASQIERPQGDLSPPALTVGFDSSDTPTVSASGDPAVQALAFSGAVGGSATSIAKSGTATTLSGAESAGSTALDVNDETGFTANALCVIWDDTNAEVLIVNSTTAGTIQIKAGLTHAYSAGANVEELNVLTTTDDAFRADGGSVAGLDPSSSSASATDANLSTTFGSILEVRCRGMNAAGDLTPEAVSRRRRGDTQYAEPRVDITAARLGSGSVDVNVTADDPTLALSSDIEFQLRDGDDQQFGGTWLTSWDTTTGIAGSDASLTRTETVSDPTTAMKIRKSFRNEAGNVETKEIEIELATVVEIASKPLVFAAGQIMPEDEATTYFVLKDVSEGMSMHPNTTASNQIYYLSVILPDGVTLTDVSARVYRNSASEKADFTFNRDGTTIASASSSSTGWHTISDTMSQVVNGENYHARIDLSSSSAVTDARFATLQIDYNAPSYKQTL